MVEEKDVGSGIKTGQNGKSGKVGRSSRMNSKGAGTGSKKPIELPWVEKYRPKRLEDVVGVDSKKKKLVDFIKQFPKVKAAVLIGPPGVGKTTLALAVARSMNKDLLEMNASDVRSADAIKHKMEESSKTRSIADFIGSTRGKILLIDEIDGIHGNQDRGGIPALVKIIEDTQFPVIMTCNEWLSKLKPLYDRAIMIKFSQVRPESIKKILKKIRALENLEDLVPDDTLEEIARNAAGDFRSAINDLESVSKALIQQREKALGGDGSPAVSQGPAPLATGQDAEKPRKHPVGAGRDELLSSITRTRDDFYSIYQGIKLAFEARDINEIRRVLGNIDLPNVSSNFEWDTIIQYIVENAPGVTNDMDALARAMEFLARADSLLGYLKQVQDWDLLPRVIDHVAAAVSILVESKPGGPGGTYNKRVVSPSFRFFRDSTPAAVLQSISDEIHASFDDLKNELFPVLKLKLLADKEYRERFLDWITTDPALKRKINKWAGG